MRRCPCATAAIVAAFGVVALLPAPAHAQQSLSDVLSFLLTNRSIPTGDFTQDEAAAAIASRAISDALLTGLATLPTSSSASGFTYRIDRNLGGAIVRSSDSFGAFFTERALTAGAERGSFGVSYQRTSFNAIDGRDLRDGSLVATASTITGEPDPFDVETLALRITSDIVTLSGNYGVTDRVDVGAAVGFVRLDMEGERIDTYRGSQLTQAAATASASGLGDLLLRVKYNLFQETGAAVSVGAEARLPTGDEDNLLGAGEASIRPRLLWSVDYSRVTLDSDIGYSFGGLTEEFTFSGAVTVVATPRLTVSGEIAGRRLDSVGRLTDTTAPHPRLVGIQTIRLSAVEDSSARVVAIGGLKWNPADTWLLGVHVMRRLTTAGLTASWVPTVAIEYSFGG